MKNRYGKLPLEEANGLIHAAVEKAGVETLPLEDCLGCILAEDYNTILNTPPFPRSPLDGYALRGEDIATATKETPVTLRVVGKTYAGDPPTQSVEEGTAIRIMTGAMLPKGCNCVIRQEDTDYGEELVEISTALEPWSNYVYEGEDTKKGKHLLSRGAKLGAAELAVVSMQGTVELSVYKQPTVAVFATGNELVPLGTPLTPAKIYDSNLTFMKARMRNLECLVVDSDFLADDVELIAERIKQAAETASMIVTTGGVSVGQKDQLPKVMEYLGGELIFWGLKMKPGSPALVWKLGKTLVICLSGNPFAATCTFELLVRPALVTASWGRVPALVRKKAILQDDFLKPSGNRRIIRGRYEEGAITLPNKHSSGSLSTMIGCNCFIDIPANTEPLHKGEEVDMILL